MFSLQSVEHLLTRPWSSPAGRVTTRTATLKITCAYYVAIRMRPSKCPSAGRVLVLDLTKLTSLSQLQLLPHIV
jgi:hypothetical protein